MPCRADTHGSTNPCVITGRHASQQPRHLPSLPPDTPCLYSLPRPQTKPSAAKPQHVITLSHSCLLIFLLDGRSASLVSSHTALLLPADQDVCRQAAAGHHRPHHQPPGPPTHAAHQGRHHERLGKLKQAARASRTKDHTPARPLTVLLTQPYVLSHPRIAVVANAPLSFSGRLVDPHRTLALQPSARISQCGPCQCNLDPALPAPMARRTTWRPAIWPVQCAPRALCACTSWRAASRWGMGRLANTQALAAGGVGRSML